MNKGFQNKKKLINNKINSLWTVLERLVYYKNNYIYIWKFIESRYSSLTKVDYYNNLEVRSLEITDKNIDKLKKRSHLFISLVPDIVWELGEKDDINREKIKYKKFRGIGIDYQLYEILQKTYNGIYFSNKVNNKYWIIGRAKQLG